MLSITLLSLPQDTLARMATHDTSGETSCRRGERIAAFGFVLLVSTLATIAAVMAL
jgi:hypothetical protein